MQVTIINRIKKMPNKAIPELRLKLPELLLALWGIPQSKTKTFFAKHFSKGHPTPTLDDIQNLLNSAVFRQISSFKPAYGPRLDGIKLICQSNQMLQVVIDEKTYFRHRAKNPKLLEELIQSHTIEVDIPCESQASTPDLRPINEMNPAFLAVASPTAEVKQNVMQHKGKDSINPIEVLPYAAIALTIVGGCVAFGVGWPLALFAVCLSSLIVFFISQNAQNTSISNKAGPNFIPVAPPQHVRNNPSLSISSEKLELPDNLILMARRNSDSPPPFLIEDRRANLENKPRNRKRGRE